MTAMGGQ